VQLCMYINTYDLKVVEFIKDGVCIDTLRIQSRYLKPINSHTRSVIVPEWVDVDLIESTVKYVGLMFSEHDTLSEDIFTDIKFIGAMKMIYCLNQVFNENGMAMIENDVYNYYYSSEIDSCNSAKETYNTFMTSILSMMKNEEISEKILGTFVENYVEQDIFKK